MWEEAQIHQGTFLDSMKEGPWTSGVILEEFSSKWEMSKDVH